jgi:C4-dicarboxylate-specific signal transduction histidine kinase
MFYIQAMLNCVPAYSWYASAKGAWIWVNARTSAYLGLPEMHPLCCGEDIGNDWKSHLALLHPDDRATALSSWEESLHASSRHEIRARIRAADETYRWFLLRAEPLRDSEGNVLLWLGINIDIDDQLRADEELRILKERLVRSTQIAAAAAMSASIAHEINQPLGAIVANAHAASTWLTASPPNISRMRIIIDRILRDSNVAADVVQKMRGLFRQQSPQKRPVDISHAVQQVLAVLDADIRKQGVEVIVDIPAGLIPLFADPVQLQQILINLISNAIDAVDGRPSADRRIWLEAEAEVDAIALRVRDTGRGVSDSDRIFETFYTTKPKGMGIGLAVSRSIAEAHDGSLSVLSQPGLGAEFTLKIPYSNDIERAEG